MANYLVVYLVAYESEQIRVVRALTRPFLNAPPKASSQFSQLHAPQECALTEIKVDK